MIKKTSLLLYNLFIVRTFSTFVAILLLAAWTTAMVCTWMCPEFQSPAAQKSSCHASQAPEDEATADCGDCQADIQLAPLPQFFGELEQVTLADQIFDRPNESRCEGSFSPFSVLPGTLATALLTTVIRV